MKFRIGRLKGLLEVVLRHVIIQLGSNHTLNQLRQVRQVGYWAIIVEDFYIEVVFLQDGGQLCLFETGRNYPILKRYIDD